MLTLVLPLMAAFLAQKGMQLIDTVMMGWIGPEALAAAALGLPIFMIIFLFCMGTLSSVGVFIVRAKGANNAPEIQSSLQHGLCIALCLSLPCMLIIWFTPHVLSSFGQYPPVINNVILLLHSLVWGFPGFLLFVVMREFISAFSLTRVVMCVALGSIPLTFSANYVLIYGKYGIPPLGIAGIGYAGAAIMWFMFLCLLTYAKKKHGLKKYISFDSFQLDWQKTKDLLLIGIPSGILLILECSLFLFAAVAMGYFGVDALAAHQIAMQCASIAFSIPFALSMATALQIGHAMGAKDIHKARRVAYIGLALGLIVTSFIATIFIFAPTQLAGLFLKGNEPDYKEILQLATSFLMISALFQGFDGIQSIANGALRGLKDTFIPMLISIGCYWCFGVGSAYYFAFYTHLGPIGIWYGFTLGLSSIGIILTIRLFYRLRYERYINKI
ncbi:MAG: MATE family efflux transporter [Legionella sp.]|nr:MATE family efflux transporter [Legionella sp.]